MIESLGKRLNLVATAVVAALALLAFSDAPRAQTPPAGTAGWTSLFDGKTLTGWRGYQRPDATGTRWVVNGGLLCVDPKAAPTGRDIVTVQKFREFDLRWEWRVAENANGGLKYLVLEDQPSAIGHEYQLMDDARVTDAAQNLHLTGGLYDLIPATSRPTRPAGQFNESRVMVAGMTVQHWLNGTKILEYELNSAPLKAAIAISKFRTVPRFGALHDAHILLQDHNDAICFRNIMIRAGGK